MIREKLGVDRAARRRPRAAAVAAVDHRLDGARGEGERLAAFGIAPPQGSATRIDVAGISPLRRARVVVPCPRCGSRDTRLVSQFGSTACKAQYRCNACREPFDYFKPH